MAICTCSVCVTVSVYIDDFGEEQPGANISTTELRKHQRQEKQRQARAARVEDHVAANIVLTTLESPASSTPPIWNRDVEAATGVSSFGGQSSAGLSSDLHPRVSYVFISTTLVSLTSPGLRSDLCRRCHRAATAPFCRGESVGPVLLICI